MIRGVLCRTVVERNLSMKYICLTTLALCLLSGGCSEQSDTVSSEYPHIIFWENHYQDGDSRWYVCYGTCDDENSVEELTFVLFETGSLVNPPGMRRVVTRDIEQRGRGRGTKQEGYLIDNIKGMIQLPTETQLYEIANGELSSSPERVSLAQIKGYLESKSNEYTLESLLAYSAGN